MNRKRTFIRTAIRELRPTFIAIAGATGIAAGIYVATCVGLLIMQVVHLVQARA